MDIFDKCKEFTEHRLAQRAGIYPYFLPIAENHGTEVTIHGKRLIRPAPTTTWFDQASQVMAAPGRASRFGSSNNGPAS